MSTEPDRNVDHSIYDSSTGLFTGRTISVPLSALAANIAEGHSSIEGVHDHLSKRIDLVTGELVDYQPPAPSAEHEWNTETKRWQLSAAAADRTQRRATALARMGELDARSIRASREALLDPIGGIERVKAINDEMELLRSQLRGLIP